MREAIELYQFYQACKSQHEGVILVTLFSTEGSSYQKAGARLLVSISGESQGLLSGGCLEGEFTRRALESWQQQQSQHYFVDTRDDGDFLLGYGLGCRGAMTVVFEPIRFKSLEAGRCERLLDPDSQLNQAIHIYDRSTQRLWRALEYDSSWDLSEGFPCALPLEKDALQDLSESLVLVEGKAERKELLVFGAGSDVLPLVELAKSLGWKTKVYDRSPARIESQNWPDGVEIHCKSIQESIAEVNNQEHVYPVIMTHNFALDLEILAGLKTKDKLSYIGLLGPQHRKEALFEELSSQGLCTKSIEPKIYAPVGLQLGGRKPSEIALSIMSQIQAFSYGYERKKMKHKDVSIVILAAGASRRLGFPKQLLRHNGRSLLQNTINTAKKLKNDGIYVVLGAYCEQVSFDLPEDVLAVYNPKWEEGMASSIRAGVRAITRGKKLSTSQSILILTVDQVSLNHEHLLNLVEEARQSQVDVAASTYGGAVGIPALFSLSLSEKMVELQGDKGGKSIIDSVENRVLVENETLSQDIDCLEDLERHHPAILSENSDCQLGL